MPASRWRKEEKHTMRELKHGVEEVRRVALRSRKSRKWARWLVANCVSKPSAVSSAAARTLSREFRPIVNSSICPGSRISDRAAYPLVVSRTSRKSFAPVELRALTVSMPIPGAHPVMRATLSDSSPTSLSSFTISRAVGRASPGPLQFW